MSWESELINFLCFGYFRNLGIVYLSKCLYAAACIIAVDLIYSTTVFL